MFELFMLKLKYLDSLSVLWQLIDHMMFDLDKRLICISNKYLKLCWIKFIMQIFITHNFDRYNYLWRIKGRWRGSPPPPTLFEHLHVVFFNKAMTLLLLLGVFIPPFFQRKRYKLGSLPPFENFLDLPLIHSNVVFDIVILFMISSTIDLELFLSMVDF